MKQSGLHLRDLKNFDVQTLILNSRLLKGNPLGDLSKRHNFVLCPKKGGGKLPVIFILPSFTGGAMKAFHENIFQENVTQTIDLLTSRKKAPRCLYVFVDASTSLGGSQFLDSSATGAYESYIIKELVPLVKKTYSCRGSEFWAVVGSSSGGYGALHLWSLYPHIFGWAGALSPDSLFEMSLLPDLIKSLPYVGSLKNSKESRNFIRADKTQSLGCWHEIANALCMSACYAPSSKKGEFFFPLDKKTGKLKNDIWKKFKKKDPIHFLPERKKHLNKAKGFYLGAGKCDEYSLQYGAVQIEKILKDIGVKGECIEFEGGHSGLSKRFPLVWNWLSKKWKS